MCCTLQIRDWLRGRSRVYECLSAGGGSGERPKPLWMLWELECGKTGAEGQDSRDTGNVTGLLGVFEYRVLFRFRFRFRFLVGGEGDLDREWRIRSTVQIRSSAGWLYGRLLWLQHAEVEWAV